MKYARVQQRFIKDFSPFSSEKFAKIVFQNLATLYGNTRRYYHNFEHVETMLDSLKAHTPANPNVIILAIWFHDAIYNPYRKDNEAKSAQFAQLILKQSSLASCDIASVVKFIEATKSHELLTPSEDLGLFLDLDLEILGSQHERYQQYARQIRQEYRWIPTALYKRGRQKVLHHFLKRNRLYFTAPFQEMYESAAKANMEWELRKLSQHIT